MRWVKPNAIDGIGRVSLSLLAEFLQQPQFNYALIFSNPEQASFCNQWYKKTQQSPPKADYIQIYTHCSATSLKNLKVLPSLVHTWNIKGVYSPYLNFVPGSMGDIPWIGTLHDLIPLLFPELFKNASKKFRWVLGSRRVLKSIVQNHAHIVTVSEHTRKDILTHLQPQRPIDVVYWGHKTLSGAKSPPELHNYILAVSRDDPYKNLEGLVQVYQALAPSLKQKHPLVIVGAEAPGSATPGIHWAGKISTDALEGYYQHASLFVHLSLYEGFGLPVLEAMSHGLPVIASNKASIPEVVGEGGILVDPLNTQETLETLTRALGNLHELDFLKDKARRQAESFQWSQAAEKILNICERIMSQSQAPNFSDLRTPL